MSRIVPAEGSLNAKIAFVGEAPGDMEERLGRPFIGPAGDQLMQIMRQVGIARSDCYFTNVVKERPPKNDFSIHMRQEKGGVWTSTTYQDYQEKLLEELSRSSANVIVPLGNSPLFALTGLVGILKRRGSILSSIIAGKERKIIPTIHPSAALRQYIFTHFIRIDLKRILKESSNTSISVPFRDITVKPSFMEVMDFLHNISVEVGVDIEVINEEVSCISFAPSPYKGISIPFISNGQDYFSPEQEVDIWIEIARIMQDNTIVKYGQNFIFDCSFLYRKYGIYPRNVRCTMIQMGIIFPDFPKGLDFITSVYTDEPYYKDEGKKWFKIGGDERNFWIYNAKDSLVVMEAEPKLLQELTRQGNLGTYQRQVKMIEPCIYMQERGLRVDVDGLVKSKVDAEKKIGSMQEELNQVAGCELNPNSPKQLIEYFYIKKRIKPYMKQGKLTTDEDAMRRLARQGIREAQLIRDIRKWRKLLGTYFNVKLGIDGRLRSAMNPIGTQTGRLSSGKDIFGVGGNIQNLPDAMRKLIIPDDGYILYNADLSQAENRIVSYIAPEPIMIEAFETGKDVHSLTGAMISGLMPAEIRRQDDEGIRCSLGTGEYTWRFWGKKSNHSLNYDLGYKSFALRFDMLEREAQYIVNRYHQMYPGVRQYHAWVQAQLAKDRTITNLFGRKRLFLDRWGNDLFKAAYAQIPQSTVADKINEHGIEYMYYHEGPLFEKVDLLNQIHDSIVFQIPEDCSWEYHANVLIALKKNLEQELEWKGTHFRIPLDIKMCRNLGKKGGVEVKINGEDIDGLARQLLEIHRELRAAPQVQIMDGDISDISLSDEEVQDTLGVL